MCRFQAKGVYEQPIMAGLEYAWRLDDDSRLLRPIDYDLFAYMRSNRFVYGVASTDGDWCVEGLWPAVDRYLTGRSDTLTPTFYSEWPRGRIYFNNFEVSSMALWTSPVYKDFIDYIDHLGGIYAFRWGDAAIKTIAVSLFVKKSDTHRFKYITYKHTWALTLKLPLQYNRVWGKWYKPTDYFLVMPTDIFPMYKS